MPFVIVGAGVFGLSSALALAKRGHKDVIVLDRLPVPAEDAASTDITKMVRPDYGGDRLYQSLVLRSRSEFLAWNAECFARGEPPLYHETGVLLATPNNGSDTFEAKSMSNLKSNGGFESTVLIPNDEIPSKAFPGLSLLRQEMPYGYFNTRAGWVDSARTVAFMAQKAREFGVRIVTGFGGTFERLIHDEHGDMVGVRTADGSIHHGVVVLAAGAWMTSIFPDLRGHVRASGQAVVHFDVREMSDVFKSVDDVELRASDDTKISAQIAQSFPTFAANIGQTGFYGFPATAAGLVKIANHGAGYLNPIGSSDGVSEPRTSVTDSDIGKRIPRDAVLKFRKFLAQYIPALNKLDIASTRMCWYTDSWDGDFYIGAVSPQDSGDQSLRRGGLFVATGGSGHGFKFAPVLGEILADAIEGHSTEATKRFAWRSPRQNEKVADGTRAAQNGPQLLHLAELASDADLTADAFKNGQLCMNNV